MLSKKEKKLMVELIMMMEKQDYLAAKFQERSIHKFTVQIFKKILKELNK